MTISSIPSDKREELLNKSLVDLIRQGDIELVENLIELGADIHHKNDYPLKVSIEYNQFDILKLLLNSGCRNHDSLAWAAQFGNLEFVKYLITIGARHDGAIILAAQYGHLEIVKYLHELGANLHVTNEAALQWSIKNKHLEMTHYILSHDCDINVAEAFCLRHSVENNWLDVTEKLLSLGAITKIAKINVQSGLIYNSIYNDSIPMYELLIKNNITNNNDINENLVESIFEESFNMIDYFIKQGADLDIAKNMFINKLIDPFYDDTKEDLNDRWNAVMSIYYYNELNKTLNINLSTNKKLKM